MPRDIDIGNNAITGTNTSPDGELKRIRRALEILIDEEVSEDDAD